MFGSNAANSVVIKQGTQVKYCNTDAYKAVASGGERGKLPPKNILEQKFLFLKYQAVKYRRNVGSLSIDMSADNRTTTLGRHIDQHIGRVSVDISTDMSTDTSRSTIALFTVTLDHVYYR